MNDLRLVDDDVKRITNSPFGKIVDDDIDVHVVTMSLGHPFPSAYLKEDSSALICNAQKEKIIIIAAGGQTLDNSPIARVMSSAALFDHIIAIGGYKTVHAPSLPYENSFNQ